MRTPHAGVQSTGLDADEQAIVAYQELCRAGRPSLDRFWAKLGPGRPMTLLSSLVKVELQDRFERGERPRAAEYLGRFPELAEESDRVVSVVYEEFCLLEEAGDRPEPSEFIEAYSEWRDSLMSQLVYHRELSQVAGVATATVKFPVAGDRFASYRLRSILGTGGAAKVYLATDDELGDRRVALKISPSVGREPSILANLDHRNIVPILGVTGSDEAGLRGICMPYRPGVTLEELIRRLGRGQVPSKAKAVWDLLDPVETDDSPNSIKLDREGWSGFPARGSFSEAVAWIGLALSNALIYLHDRGVRHRDIKPANVLLAYREGPQLLDFNLAHDRFSPEQAHAALKGGTLPYMAPEQLRAFVDPAAWPEVDAPADIYALGLVLRELVSGTAPELPNRHFTLPRAIQTLHDRRACPGVPIRKINPAVPPSLESIIAKCLAFESADRYASADDLAEDLRRFLDRRPLRVATNTSIIERGANWVCRNRNRVAGATICLALMIGGLGTRSSRSIETDPDFKAAAIEFEKGSHDRREATQKKFERLHEIYDTSAWPSLYLGLIFEEGHHSKKADRCFADACACGDAEAAITRLRDRMPGSSTLNNTLGLYLLNHERPADARSALLLSMAINPQRSGTLGLLSRLEQQSRNFDASIGYLEQALRFGEGIDADPSVIRNRRSVLLFLYARLIDREIADVKDEAGWRKIKGLIAAMGDRLRRLDAAWPAGVDSADENLRRFVRHYYEGVLASNRGAVAFHEEKAGEAEAEYKRAGDCFAKATLAELDTANRDKYRGELRRAETLNRQRMVRPLEPRVGSEPIERSTALRE